MLYAAVKDEIHEWSVISTHTANLRTMVRANGLVALPPGSGLVPAGSLAQRYLLDEPVHIWQNSADQPGKGVPHR